MAKPPALTALAAICLGLIAGAGARATAPAAAGPPIFFASVIVAGGNQGIQLYSPIPRTGTTFSVRPNVNGDTKATGSITRKPGDAESAFFRGRFGRKKVRPQATLPLAEQPRDVSSLSSAVARIHGALAAMSNHHRTPRQALTEGLGELNAARTDVQNSGRAPGLIQQVVAEINAAEFQTQSAINYLAHVRRPKAKTVRRLIRNAVKAAQAPFERLVDAGLNRGYDVLLQDDVSPGDKLQFNTATGAYRFLCEGVHTGVGRVTERSGGFSLSVDTPTRRVRATVNPGTRSGDALLQDTVGVTVCAITDSNYTNNTAPSPF